ncbi:hypothetical protein FOA43_004449 [Brettanomyces nanus]|uniref:Exocyst complex component Sec8 n=1 Tax=Eeniella nana TaxID=13502 RepID=A0A875S618_EENNA|nr:uncharacterized protein FOA43_004449 [Brettanomyces nanus]QPG77051.1 hypothetical protein FOA43_004449 [Brettanomyces nanus]
MDSSLLEVTQMFESIEDDWPELLNQNFNPLQLALRLLDNSSVGDAYKYPKFLALKQEFSESLKKAVNTHYMSFNDSIGAFGIAVESIAESHGTLMKIKDDLENVDEFVGQRASFLTELNSKQRKYSDTIEVLENIGYIRESSEKIDDAISSRDFDMAKKLILESSKIANKYGLWNIATLNSAQVYLQAQSQTLFNSLIDEINDVIYVKGVGDSPEASTLLKITTSAIEDVSRVLEKPLEEFLEELKGGISEGFAPGSDTRSFHSLRRYLALLAELDGEQDALKLLVQRCGTELRRLARRTAEEVKNRYPDHTAYTGSTGSISASGSTVASSTTVGASNSAANSVEDILGFSNMATFQGINTAMVSDFFTSLFRRCISVLQLHRAIFIIAESRGLVYDFHEVWKQLQAQLGSAIYSYIVDEDLLESVERQQDNGRDPQSLFIKSPKDFYSGDTSAIFQLAQFSLSDDPNQSSSRELQSVLQDMFPGQFRGPDSANDGSLFIEDDSDELFHLKKTVLVPPGIFNMTAITDSFLLFVGSASLIFPSDEHHVPILFFTHFMDYVFRTQLENTLLYQFDRIAVTTGSDYATSMKQFFSSILTVLDTSSYYREPYAEIVIKLLDKMVSKYQSIINEIVPPEFLRKVKTRLIASWFGNQDLLTVSKQLLNDGNDNGEALSLKELQLCLKHGKNTFGMIKEHDFLDFNRFIAFSEVLHGLLETLKWLPGYKREVKLLNSDGESISFLKKTWHIMDSDVTTLHCGTNGELESTTHPYLALHGKSVEKFNTVVSSLQEMSMKIKLYIRYDLRIKSIWCVCRMFSKESWMPEYETEGIDADVLAFNGSVMETNRLLQQMMPDKDRMQIFMKLPNLLDHLLVSESSRIIKINSNGIYRVFVNVRVLQQMLRNVLDPKEVDFSRSLGYYELFKSTDKGILESISKAKETGLYTEDDYKNMIRLVFSESITKDMKVQRTSSYSASKRYTDTVKKLKTVIG